MDELNNTQEKEKFLNFIVKMYESKEYKYLLDNWKVLESNERQEILYRAYKDNIRLFVGPKHFEEHPADKQVLANAMEENANKLGMNFPELGEVFWGFKGKKYETLTKDEATVERTLATYVRLREYCELVDKYHQIDFLEILKLNRSILKCDSVRTEARLKFLLEQNNGFFSDKTEVARELSLINERFNLKYQRDIEQKLFLLEPGSVAYSTLASRTGDIPDSAYDKFLELALRVVYGDKKLIGLIERERKKAFKEKMPKIEPIVDETNINNQEPELPEIPAVVPVVTEEEVIVEELFGGALPAEEGMKNPAGTGKGRATTIPNARETLDDEKIDKFLKDLRETGINCEGFIESDSGFKANGEESVRFYILKVNDYLILEPIGQVGNGTYVIQNVPNVEELKTIITTNTKPDLVRKGIAIMLKHDRSEDQEYVYSTQRIANMAAIIEEFSKPERETVSISKIREQVTALIPKEEAPEAAEYVWKLGICQKEKLAKKIVEFEGKLGAGRKKKPKTNDSTEGAEHDD